MAPASRLLAPVALLLLAGSLVLLFFVILSGLTHTSPLRQTYFLRADTSGISGARDVSQWTFFSVCGLDNTDCGPRRPALPLGDAWDSGAQAVPAELMGSHGGGTTSGYYWYMWRFGWVFYLIALFFEVLAFGAGFLACCSRLGAALAGLVALAAWVFLTVAVSLMTATFVKMRNAFVADGRAASVGSYAIGFSWGAWAALFLGIFFFCLIRGGRRRDAATAAPAAAGTRHGWFRRRRNTVNGRGYDGRRVKDEYA